MRKRERKREAETERRIEKKLTHLLHNVWREDSGGEGPTEDVGELFVQATDAHALKVPVWVDDRLARLSGLRLPCRGHRHSYKHTVHSGSIQALNFFHILLQPYSKIDLNCFFNSSIHTPHTHNPKMTKQKQFIFMNVN